MAMNSGIECVYIVPYELYIGAKFSCHEVILIHEDHSVPQLALFEVKELAIVTTKQQTVMLFMKLRRYPQYLLHLLLPRV